MKTLIFLTLSALAFTLGLQAQTLTISIDAPGVSKSKTITGPPVAFGLEVLETFRLTQFTEANGVKVYKYADVGEVLQALIVGKILELGDQYPTSATAALRAAKAKAEADIAAARKALEAAAIK
jgi:hypothetical protein